MALIASMFASRSSGCRFAVRHRSGLYELLWRSSTGHGRRAISAEIAAALDPSMLSARDESGDGARGSTDGRIVDATQPSTTAVTRQPNDEAASVNIAPTRRVRRLS